MGAYLSPLLHLQRFFLPALFFLVVLAVWRTVWRKDLAVGLAFYLGLVIIVDGFFNTGLFIPGLAKGSIHFSELCALFLFVGRPGDIGERRDLPLIRFLVGAYFVLLFLSALRAAPMISGIFEFRRLIIPQIIAFVITKRGIGSAEEYRRFFLALTVLVIIIGLFVFWDVFFDRWLLYSDMLLTPEYSTNRKHGRFGSFFFNPNFLGAFVVLVFPLAFVFTLREHRKGWGLLAWGGLLSLIFCLVETKSRGPLLAFGISLAMLVLGPLSGISRARRFGFFALFLGIVLVFMPGFFEHATERFTALDDEKSEEEASRQTNWLYTKRIIADQPVLGIGFGEKQFVNAMERYGYAEAYGRVFDNPHNSYLQIAVYAGIPALIAFILANALLLRKGIVACTVGANKGDETMVFGLAVGILGFLLCMYPDMHLFTQNVAPLFWVFFGLLYSQVASTPELTTSVQGRVREVRSRKTVG